MIPPMMSGATIWFWKDNECTRLTSVLQVASHVKSTGSYLRLDVFLKDTGDRGKLDINILVWRKNDKHTTIAGIMYNRYSPAILG